MIKNGQFDEKFASDLLSYLKGGWDGKKIFAEEKHHDPAENASVKVHPQWIMVVNHLASQLQYSLDMVSSDGTIMPSLVYQMIQGGEAFLTSLGGEDEEEKISYGSLMDDVTTMLAENHGALEDEETAADTILEYLMDRKLLPSVEEPE